MEIIKRKNLTIFGTIIIFMVRQKKFNYFCPKLKLNLKLNLKL